MRFLHVSNILQTVTNQIIFSCTLQDILVSILFTYKYVILHLVIVGARATVDLHIHIPIQKDYLPEYNDKYT